MLQSPPSVYHDSGFRLQTLMHGRNYLSPIQGASVPHQASGVPPVDSPQYRGFICHPSSHHHRLPHFPLSIPPVDILPQYQPHHAGGLGQVGYPPPGLLSSGRPGHLQPSALDSYSQTLFNLSQQAHISPQTVVQQQVVRQTAAAGKGADDRGTIGARDVDGSDRFPLFGMIGYMKPFDGRFSDKNSAQDLSMKASGALGHRLRHSQTTTTMTLKQHSDDSSTSPFCHSQCQSQKHHPQKSNNARNHGACETQRNNNNNDDDDNDCCASNNRKEYFAVDKFKDEVGPSWRPTMPCPVYPMSSEMDFLSFKDPNSIGVHQPSDQRSYPRNGFTNNNNNNNNYPSNTTTPAASASSSSSSSSSLSPSGVNNHGGTRSSPLTSASPSASSSHSLYPPASSSSSARSPVAHHRHFAKGSVIQLASGQLKRVEDLTTEDFLDGRRVRDDLSVNTSRVTHVRLNHDNGTAVIGFAVGQKLIQVSVEAAVEHPFFVYNRGWSSCNPSKTLEHYGLPCLQLAIGDTCISLTHRYPGSPAPASDNQPADEEEFPSSPKTRKSSKGYKMSPPCCNQSPEPQMVPGGVMVPPRRDDDGSQVVVSPETRLGPSGGLRVGRRKRRWSAPDNGSSAAERRTLAESPVLASYDPLEADQNVQSPVVLTVA